MVSFEKKILSVAYSFEYNTQGFIRHTCPTLKGTSGGMFMSFEELFTCEHPCFIGIHVGGTEGKSNNYCVPVLRPEFALEYKRVLEQNFGAFQLPSGKMDFWKLKKSKRTNTISETRKMRRQYW